MTHVALACDVQGVRVNEMIHVSVVVLVFCAVVIVDIQVVQMI